uniref:C-type lectin domain family 4 member M-like n=1 Tax=Sparus aurata TaxID=8175 RepID=A0A671YWF7_SPAAU
MDMENSKIGYKQFFTDGSKLQSSVYAMRNSPFRMATVCLGLLCLILLLGVIGQSVHYQKAEQEHQSNLKTMHKEKENLQDDLRRARKQKTDLEVTNTNLRESNDQLSNRYQRTDTNNNLLSRQVTELKSSQSQLQASNTATTKEIEALKATNDQLQTNNNALTTAKDLIQKQYDIALNRKNELQANYVSVTKERDNLQNKYNVATRQKNQLQMNYNTLIKDVEHLQDRYNHSTNEKDKLANSHLNLTVEKESLQTGNDILEKSLDELQASYKSLNQEKQEVESGCQNVTVERDLLMKNNDNLTAERDVLQLEIEKLKAKIQEKPCPTDWRKYEGSCYYTSTGKKTWRKGREYCQSKGADLAIVTSQEEMIFINSLYPSDKQVWIGLTDQGVEGQWKWVDGSPLTTMFWGTNQPNSSNGRNQDCAEFRHRATGTGDWNDESCNAEQNWICEM